MSVHFPIAFLYLAGGLYLFHAFKSEAFYFRMAKLVHTLGLVGLILAMISGRIAASEIEIDSPLTELVRNHEIFGYGAIWAFSMMLVWVYLRSTYMKRGESGLFIGIFVLFLLLLGYSSSLGGEIAHPV